MPEHVFEDDTMRVQLPNRWGTTQQLAAAWTKAGFKVNVHRSPGESMVIMEIEGILDDLELIAVDKRSGWSYGPVRT